MSVCGDDENASPQTLAPHIESEATKQCRSCKEVKPLADFHANKKSDDGRKSQCAQCNCARVREWTKKHPERTAEIAKKAWLKNRDRCTRSNLKWLAAHPEQALAYGRKYRAANPDKERARARKYREAHKEQAKEYRSRYFAKNPELRNAWDAARRAQELIAMPPWADKKAIAAIYRAAKAKTKETCVEHHVDHIIPLKHKLVCGLHVPANLQVLPGIENNRKSNRFSADLHVSP